MVGGRDFRQYYSSTGATQAPAPARARPSSSFVYTAAIENGFTPADTIEDLPVVYKDATGLDWKPENFDKKPSRAR